MPSKSKSQQRFFGMIHACQKTGNCASKAIRKKAKEISYDDVEKFASTKHKKLPEHKRKSFREWLKTRR